MKSFVKYCLLLLLTGSLNAQQSEIDSLLQVIKTHPTKDTLRLDAINDLVYLYNTFNTDEGLKWSQEAISLSETLNDPKRLAAAYNNLASTYIIKGKDSLAMRMYDKAIQTHKRIDNEEGVARATFNKGLVYFNRSDYRASLEHYTKAFAYFKKEQDSSAMAKILNSIGVTYMYLGDHTQSLKTYLYVLKIQEEIGLDNSLNYANTLCNIGILYKNIDQLSKAISNHQNALKIYRARDYKLGTANTLGNLGVIYDQLNNPAKAVELYKESNELYKSIGDERGLASSLTNLGIAYTSLSNYDEALRCLNQSISMYDKWKDYTNLGVVKRSIGIVYMTMADKNLIDITDGYNKAADYFNESILDAKKAHHIKNQLTTLADLSQVYYKQGHYKRAFEVKEQSDILKDSILSEDKRAEIVRLEEQYAFDKKASLLKASNDKEQALAALEIKRQKEIKNSSIIGGGALVGIVVFGLVVYKRKRDAIALKKEAEFKTTVVETELKALRAQMNPHFIFNSLNSINDFIAKNDANAAQNYLTKFAKIMRQTLESSNQKEITLDEDLKLLELYLQIEAMRLKYKFTYEIKLDDALDLENTLIPPLILQPFIENSIWHGISNKKGKGHIIVELKKQSDMLLCSVDDDGVGRQKLQAMKEKKSMGVAITKSRIEIINKLKNSHGKVKIIDKPQGVRVEILLPLQLAF